MSRVPDPSGPEIFSRRFGHFVIAVLSMSCVSGANAMAGEQDRAGTLVIAGGAVSAGNSAIFQTFLNAMPDPSSGKIAVISAASVAPVQSAQSFRTILHSHAIADARIAQVQLAVCDDEETPDVDESRWSANGQNPEEIEKIATADAIWFTGGDQSRLTQVLFDDQGASTPMLRTLRQRLAQGAVLGGTSAGAAAMSDPMITGGDTLASLLGNDRAGERLSMGQGLGFFRSGLVDQHFDARARLGRLAMALEQLSPERRIGFGIDEDTALVFSASTGTVSVAGAGGVTILDGRNANWSRVDDRTGIRGLVLSILYPGDQLMLETAAVAVAGPAKPTVGNELNTIEPSRSDGMAVPGSSLARLLGEQLLDNKAADAIERYSFGFPVSLNQSAENAEPAQGVLYRFSQLQNSAGYRGLDADGGVRYTILRVGFDIEPVDATVVPVRQQSATLTE